jgi:hypothetical protein
VEKIFLISYCGFYCGACPIYLKGKCKGCKELKSTTHYKSCKVKPCCIKNGYSTCAECNKYQSIDDCKDFNPLFVRFSQFLTQTNRKKGIEMIKKDGANIFLEFIANKKWFNMKRNSKRQ